MRNNADKKKLRIGIAAIFISILTGLHAIASGADVKLTIDDPEQEYKNILLYKRNLPAPFDMSGDPAYKGHDYPFTVTDLTPEQTYEFQAYFETETGERSAGSNIVQYKVPAIVKPVAPQITAISNGVETTFVITAPGEADTYRVRYAKAPEIPDFPDNPASFKDSTESTITITGLEQGSTYNYYTAYRVGGVWSERTELGAITIPTVIHLKAPVLIRID